MDFLELGNARVALKCPVSGRIKVYQNATKSLILKIFCTQEQIMTAAKAGGGRL